MRSSTAIAPALRLVRDTPTVARIEKTVTVRVTTDRGLGDKPGSVIRGVVKTIGGHSARIVVICSALLVELTRPRAGCRSIVDLRTGRPL
jgi:hypothetical protein